MAPKIQPKSIKNRSKNWSYFWSHFGRAKVPKIADLGTPRTLKTSDSSTLLKDFHIFCKSHFVTIFIDFGLHFGGFWDPKLAFFGDQKPIKKLINFWIHFLSILEPSWVPKWSQNPPKSVREIDLRVFFEVLEPTWYPKRLQEGFKAPKTSKKVTSKTVCLMIYNNIFNDLWCIFYYVF